MNNNELANLGYDPGPPESFVDFPAFEKDFFKNVQTHLRCLGTKDDIPCNGHTLRNHGLGGSTGQGGIKLIQVECKNCLKRFRLRDLLEKQGYFMLLKLYTSYWEVFTRKGIEKQSGQRSITNFLQKPPSEEPLSFTQSTQEIDEIVMETQDTEMDPPLAIEATQPDYQMMVRMIESLQQDKEQNQEIIRDLSEQIRVLTNEIREMRLAAAKPPLAPGPIVTGTIRKSSHEFSPAKRNATPETVQQMTSPVQAVTGILKRPSTSVITATNAAMPTANSSKQAATRSANANNEPALAQDGNIIALQKQVESLTLLVTRFITNQAPESIEPLSTDPTPAEAAQASYAKVAAKPAPGEIKRKRMLKKNQTRLLKMVCEKPPPATFSKIYIRIVETKEFKAVQQDPHKTALLITKLLKAIKINRQVTASSKIGNSLLELYIPDAVLPSVRKTLTELKITIIADIDVNTVPVFAKVSPEVVKQKVINRLAYLYGRYKFINFRKCVLSGISPEMTTSVLALVHEKEQAKAARLAETLEAVVFNDQPETDHTMDIDISDDEVAPEPQPAPSSAAPTGDDATVVAPSTLC